MSRFQAWLEILLVPLLFGLSGVLVSLLAAGFPRLLPMPVLLLAQGGVVLAGLTVLLARRGQHWRDVGLKPFVARDPLRALVVFASCAAANLVLTLSIYLTAPDRVETHVQRLESIAALLAEERSMTAVAATMFLVGAYEELSARGFLLARCRAALGGVWPPVLLSSLVFGLGHLYQGVLGVLQTAVIGAILALYTVHWGTLWPAIIAHALLNTLSIAALEGMRSQQAALTGVGG
ncbi:MAG: CPBP family intramembrane metalloprotease [Gammaproteobacteria bacterium]